MTKVEDLNDVEEFIEVCLTFSREAAKILGIETEINIELYNNEESIAKAYAAEFIDAYTVCINMADMNISINELKVIMYHEVYHIHQMIHHSNFYEFWSNKTMKHYTYNGNMLYYYSPTEVGAYIFGNSLGKIRVPDWYENINKEIVDGRTKKEALEILKHLYDSLPKECKDSYKPN